MRGLRLSLLVGLVVFVAAACGNKDAEKRIAELESKIAEMEGAATTLASPNSTPAEPETKPEGPLPAFAFAEEEFDFGTINEGDVVEHVFKFTNTSDKPLTISNARGSCGCTVPEWPREPIAPGEDGEIKVKFIIIT